jgi:hypothetical protein
MIPVLTRVLTAATLLWGTLLCPASGQPEQNEAPFGLTWGQSSGQIQAVGVELKSIDRADYGKTFVATRLPRALADQETALLSFGHNDKLWRIVALGRPNENDPTGASVRARYDELRGILEEKYGRAKSVHRLGDHFYSKPENFVYGISKGESYWYSSFENNGAEIELAIIAPDMSKSRWRIIVTQKTLARDFEDSKRAIEKKAL